MQWVFPWDSPNGKKGWGDLAGFVMYPGINYVVNVFMGVRGITEESISVDSLTAAGYSMTGAQKKNALYGYVLGIFTCNTSIFVAIISALAASFIHGDSGC